MESTRQWLLMAQARALSEGEGEDGIDTRLGSGSSTKDARPQRTRVRCDIGGAKAKEIVEKLVLGLLRACRRAGMRTSVEQEMNML